MQEMEISESFTEPAAHRRLIFAKKKKSVIRWDLLCNAFEE